MGRMPGKEVFGLTAIGQIRRLDRKNLIAKNSLKNTFARILVSFTDYLTHIITESEYDRRRKKRSCKAVCK